MKRCGQLEIFLVCVAALGCGGGSTTARQQPAASPAAEPAPIEGAPHALNETWLSSDVDSLVDRLEVESREPFKYRAEIADLVAPRPGSTVADVGAGSGFMVYEFSRRVGPSGKVIAVEINQGFLDRITARAAELGLANISTILGAVDSTNLPEASVDLVFIGDTYHHFEDPTRVMASVWRALRPGGEVVVLDLERGPEVPYSTHDWPWWQEHLRGDKDTFRKEIESLRFRLVKDYTDTSFLKESYVLRFAKVEGPG